MSGGLNLTHNVGVVMHAQGNLSHMLDKLGSKFLGLEKQSKNFNKLQDESAKHAERSGKMVLQNSIAQQQAAMRAGKSYDMLQQKVSGLGAATEKLQAQQQTLWEKQSGLYQQVHADRIRMLNEHGAKQQMLVASHQAALTQIETHGNKARQAEQAKIEEVERKRTKISRTGAQLIHPEMGRLQNTKSDLEAEIRARKAVARAALRKVDEIKLDDNGKELPALSAAERTAQRNAILNKFKSETSGLNTELTSINKRVEGHHQLVALQQQEEAHRHAISAIDTDIQQKQHAAILQHERDTVALAGTEDARRKKMEGAADRELQAIDKQVKLNEHAHEKLTQQKEHEIAQAAELHNHQTNIAHQQQQLRDQATASMDHAHAQRMNQLEDEMRMEEKRAKFMKGVGLAAGGAITAVAAGSAAYHAIHNIAEATNKTNTSYMQIGAMGLDRGEYAKVISAIKAQTAITPGTTYAEVANNFKGLVDLFGTAKGVLGPKLNDQHLLTFASKLGVVGKGVYNMSDAEIFQLERASELPAAARIFDVKNQKMRNMTTPEMQEHWLGRARMTMGMIQSSGGKLKAGEVLAAQQQLKEFRFALSDKGYGNLLQLVLEGKGGVQANALQSFLTNVVYGKQAGYMNENLVKAGMFVPGALNNPKLVQWNKKHTAILSHSPLALKGGAEWTSDPITAIYKYFGAQAEKTLLAQGKAAGVKNMTDEVFKALMPGFAQDKVGRNTARQIATEVVMQYPKIKRGQERFAKTSSIEEQYTQLMLGMTGQTAKFNAVMEKLKTNLGTGVLPPAIKLLDFLGKLAEKINKVLEADRPRKVPFTNFKIKPSELIGAFTGAALAAPIAAGLVSLFGVAILSKMVLSAVSTGLKTMFMSGLASRAVQGAMWWLLGGAIRAQATMVAVRGAMAAVMGSTLGSPAVRAAMLNPGIAIGVALAAAVLYGIQRSGIIAKIQGYFDKADAAAHDAKRDMMHGAHQLAPAEKNALKAFAQGGKHEAKSPNLQQSIAPNATGAAGLPVLEKPQLIEVHIKGDAPQHKPVVDAAGKAIADGLGHAWQKTGGKNARPGHISVKAR